MRPQNLELFMIELQSTRAFSLSENGWLLFSGHRRNYVDSCIGAVMIQFATPHVLQMDSGTGRPCSGLTHSRHARSACEQLPFSELTHPPHDR